MMPVDHRENFDDLVMYLHEAADNNTVDSEVIIALAKLVKFTGTFLFALEKQINDIDRRLREVEDHLPG